MQRQLRLGDILDDYCPRERRVTNHAIVAMLGSDIKQTRCTTCDAEHEYKQAKVPRQRRKTETPAALYAAALTGGPKRVAHGAEQVKEAVPAPAPESGGDSEPPACHESVEADREPAPVEDPAPSAVDASGAGDTDDRDVEEGPVHRPLIRASLPRPEGTPPLQRPGPDFTIRQPGGRPPNRFRQRHQRGPSFQNQGSRGNTNIGGPQRGGMTRHGGSGRPQGGGGPHPLRRHGPGRKRSK